mmetsp:Transcript_6762/g.25006  ORF Transcript_6762/g.25006 Transcript_6762/m.25006 type:complete len:413 (-) Transcript_6762:177-1415(-)|eukprot:scaffold3259_cov373-Prasinococcus_capsulatus_cf.AAC.7
MSRDKGGQYGYLKDFADLGPQASFSNSSGPHYSHELDVESLRAPQKGVSHVWTSSLSPALSRQRSSLSPDARGVLSPFFGASRQGSGAGRKSNPMLQSSRPLTHTEILDAVERADTIRQRRRAPRVRHRANLFALLCQGFFVVNIGVMAFMCIYLYVTFVQLTDTLVASSSALSLSTAAGLSGAHEALAVSPTSKQKRSSPASHAAEAASSHIAAWDLGEQHTHQVNKEGPSKMALEDRAVKVHTDQHDKTALGVVPRDDATEPDPNVMLDRQIISSDPDYGLDEEDDGGASTGDGARRSDEEAGGSQMLTVLYSRNREDLMKGGSYCDSFKVKTTRVGSLEGRAVVDAFQKDNPELEASKCTFRMSLTQSGFHMLDPEHTIPIDRGSTLLLLYDCPSKKRRRKKVAVAEQD